MARSGHSSFVAVRCAFEPKWPLTAGSISPFASVSITYFSNSGITEISSVNGRQRLRALTTPLRLQKASTLSRTHAGCRRAPWQWRPRRTMPETKLPPMQLHPRQTRRPLFLRKIPGEQNYGTQRAGLGGNCSFCLIERVPDFDRNEADQ